jgi:hypothetical protein
MRETEVLISRKEPRVVSQAVAVGLALAVVVPWLAYLLLQAGHPWDEAEHAHVAWLISQGKRPLVDFFQHHQPLLWSLLTPYFRLGFNGAGVLLWGRVLVVCSALAAIISLRRLGHWLGVAVFIGLTVAIPELFVTRPETISTALLLVALAIWANPAPDIASALAGMAVGAAVYASPRFALTGAFFLLMGQQSVRRWVFLCCGAIVFVALYTMCSGYPLSEVLFNIEFSAHLQTVGDLPFWRPQEFWLLLFVCAWAPLAVLIVAVRQSDRARSAFFLVYTVAIFLTCDYVAGYFRYAQAYAPFLAALAITAGWITQHLELPPNTRGTLALIVAATFLFGAIAALVPWLGLQPLSLMGSIKARDQLAASIPPQEAVMLYTLHSPIAVRDVSYYGSPIADGRDRLCTAVRGFKTTLRLPVCDFFAELVKRPYLTETNIQKAMRVEDAENATAILRSDYQAQQIGGSMVWLAVRR